MSSLSAAMASAGTLSNVAINITGNSNQLLLNLSQSSQALALFGGKAEKEGKKATDGFETFVKKLKQVTSQIGAVAAAVESAFPLAQMADDAEAAMRRLERAFGNGTAAVLADIDRLQGAFAAPRNELIAMAADAGRTFEGMGLSAAKSAEMTSALMKRSVDIAADGTMTQAQAMHALIDAVRGGGGALARLGAGMTQAEIHTKAIELGFVHANRAITDTELAIVRFAVALDGTKAVEGAAAERAAKLGGDFTQLQASVSGLATEIGTTLTPAFQLLVDSLTWVIEKLKSATAAMREFIRDAGLVIGAGFDIEEAGKLIAARDQVARDDKAAEDRRKLAAADKGLDARKGQLQHAQFVELGMRGNARTSLSEFARSLQAASYRQKGTPEKQLDVLNQINGAVQKGVGKLAAPGVQNVKPAGGP